MTPPIRSIRLHIDAEQTTVTAAPDVEPGTVLAIGSRKTAADFFRHMPPTPAELETAIMVVEDEVNRARTLVAGATSLVTSDALVRDIARMAGVRAASGCVLSVEQVESVFDLLAAFSQGRPVSSAGIPEDPAFAATLLILREFMHHLQFAVVTVDG